MREDGRMKREAEIGAMCLQVKDCQGSPRMASHHQKLVESQETASPGPQVKISMTNTLISDFWLPEL